MSGNRGNRHADDKKQREPPVDLENQFIMRLPEEPAKALRELLQSGAPLKDRLSIKIENNEMRYGEVRFDRWLFHAKVVDLPTIVESLKTIDNKSFYKTADICQMLLCREEDDQTTDDESQVQKKKKDPNKVDKKYLWPHGITPPIKNVRKKRFRKTLRKKYVEAPEIEKEIKRLFQGDAGAVNFKWEVICDEDVGSNKPSSTSSGAVKIKKDVDENNGGGGGGGLMENVDVAEHDIFGEPVSDSEDDDDERNINAEMDETSRLSGDSRVSDSNSMQVSRYSERSRQETTTTTTAPLSNPLVTQFTRDMFPPDNTNEQDSSETLKEPKVENPFHSEYMIPDSYCDTPNVTTQRDSLQSRLATLHAQLAEIRQKKQAQENNMAETENTSLRERFQAKLQSLISEERQKMQEIQELEME